MNLNDFIVVESICDLLKVPLWKQKGKLWKNALILIIGIKKFLKIGIYSNNSMNKDICQLTCLVYQNRKTLPKSNKYSACDWYLSDALRKIF